MGTYIVRDGCTLAHHGKVLSEGDSVELPDAVASDPAVACRVTVRRLPESVPERPRARAVTDAAPAETQAKKQTIQNQE